MPFLYHQAILLHLTVIFHCILTVNLQSEQRAVGVNEYYQ